MWILIDGNNWFARDFYAAGTLASTTFLNRLADVQSQLAPERVAIAWDSRSFRHELDSNYKAGRSEKPPGFTGSLCQLRETVAGMDVFSIAVDGFEADDLLASMAASAIDEGERAMIFSSDRDLHQCLAAERVNQVTEVRRIHHQTLSFGYVTAATLLRDQGVHPHQWVEFRAIVGDKSDNILGCPGLGKVAAAAVLRDGRSLDDFYRNPLAAKLTGSQREKLLAHRPQLPALRQILTLRTDAPLPVGWLEAVAL